jgi:coronin-1B/1C/6
LKLIQDEIRKLKAVIVKHENRIRALEAQAKSRDEENNITDQSKMQTTTAPDSTSTPVRANLAPDEV